MQAPRTYGYRELAQRIQDVLGVRPSTSSLRAAAAASRRATGNQSRPRLTLGMPSPEPDHRRTAPARFDAAKVERWLASHPLLRWRQSTEAFRAALHRPELLQDEAIAQARTDGLSWEQITDILHAEGSDSRSRAAIHAAYRHLDPQPTQDSPPRPAAPHAGGPRGS